MITPRRNSRRGAGRYGADGVWHRSSLAEETERCTRCGGSGLGELEATGTNHVGSEAGVG